MSKKVLDSKNYYGFMHELPTDDKRIPIFMKQIKERGFDDTETWSLCDTILSFTLPRLKQFRESHCNTVPNLELSDEEKKSRDFNDTFLSFDEWNEKLDKMIEAIEIRLGDKSYGPNDPEWKKTDEGFDLFFMYFFELWW